MKINVRTENSSNQRQSFIFVTYKNNLRIVIAATIRFVSYSTYVYSSCTKSDEHSKLLWKTLVQLPFLIPVYQHTDGWNLISNNSSTVSMTTWNMCSHQSPVSEHAQQILELSPISLPGNVQFVVGPLCHNSSIITGESVGFSSSFSSRTPRLPPLLPPLLIIFRTLFPHHRPLR